MTTTNNTTSKVQNVTLKQANRMLFWFGLRYIPLIGFCRPTIRQMDEKSIVISMPHSWQTKNHLGSIYFGALAIGADLAGAFLVFSKAKMLGINANFAFKDVKGEFLKRPEAEVFFQCHDGEIIDQMMHESVQTGQRINKTVQVTVTCPSLHADEPMATFSLTLSVKASRRH